MNIEENIRKWVVLDNNYKKLTNQMREIRNEKNNITEDLINQFHNKNTKFPIINISDGKLSLTNTKTANVLSYNFLIQCFKEFYKAKHVDESEELLEFIKSKRTYNNVTTIKRSYNN